MNINIINNVELFHSSAYDFIASLFRLNCNDHLISNSSFSEVLKLKRDESIIKWVNETIKEVPEIMKVKLEAFFNFETFYGMCMHKYILQFRVKDVEQFIELLTKLPPVKYLQVFIGTGYTQQGLEEDVEELVDRLVAQNSEAVKFINENMNIPSQYKWQLLEFFLQPQKMKEDFLELINWYYHNIYSKMDNSFQKIVLACENELTKNIKRYGEEYIRLFYSDYKLGDKVVFSLSYFYEFSLLASYDTEDNLFFTLVGFRHTETFDGKKHSVLSGIQLFKALADETRLNIIRMIFKKPMYGKELAESLELSNSTVSYHISLLVMNKIIYEERLEGKIFYSVNQEKLKELLCQSVDNILIK